MMWQHTSLAAQFLQQQNQILGQQLGPLLSLGKPQGGRMKPGKPILMDGQGNVIYTELDDLDAAKREAKRLARVNNDEVYVYTTVTKFQPSEPKVEEVAV